MEKRYVKILSIVFGIAGIGTTVYKFYVRQDRKQIIETANEAYFKGDFERCRQIMTAYIGKYPEQPDGWTYIGMACFELDLDSQAVAAYEHALVLDEEYSRAMVGLGIVRKYQKNIPEAERLYLKAIKTDPKYAQSYSSLLIIELQKGNLQKAVELGEKAMSLNDKENGIKGNLMLAYHYAGQFEKRDALRRKLEQSNYPDLVYLDMLMTGDISLDLFSQ